MPCGHRPSWPSVLRGEQLRARRAASRRRRARARPGARRAAPPRSRCRGGAARSARGRRRARRCAPPRWGRGTSGRGRAPSRVDAPCRWRRPAARSRPAPGGCAGAGCTIGIEHRRRWCRRAARPSSACGSSQARGRGRGSARGRSPIPPAPAAGPRGSARAPPRAAARRPPRGRRWHEQRGAARARYSVSTNSLPKAGWARSSAGGASDDLGVARDLDLARAVAVVGHGQPAHLDVVLGGDRDVELGRDVVVAAPEGRLLGEERDQVVVRLCRAPAGRSADHTAPLRTSRR